MKRTKVIQLGQIRDLLTEWDKVRQRIIAGKLSGFSIILMGDADRETVILGGVYQDDPQAAVRAALRMSAARTLAEDRAAKTLQSGT